jgi:large subunit ribosomal protein L15
LRIEDLTMRLNELSDNPGAKHARKRLGRGIGSGLGKTSGKGHKGAKARKSNPKPGSFEGGQMPIYRRLPKRGFKNIGRPDYVTVNLDRLQAAIDSGKLAVDGTVDGARLVEAGLLRRTHDGVRLLARGELKAALTIEVVGASKAAVEAVAKAGGKVVILGGEDAAAQASV